MTEHRAQNPEYAPPARPSPSKGKGGGLQASARPVFIALWLALLFLPFKGYNAALILFISVLAFILVLRFFEGRIKPLKEKLHDLKTSLKGALQDTVSGAILLRSRVFRRRAEGQLRLASYAALLLLLIIPLITTDYLLDIAILAGIYIILAQGLNVVVGFAGLLNLGFVAFYAIGAYAYALLNTKLGLGFWPSLPVSVLLTALSGFVLAIPALRLRGDYLAIVTLGFGEIVRLVLNNWDSVTRGPNGIGGIERPYLLGMPMNKLSYYYYLVLAFALITVFVVKRVHASRIGRAWIAIREDEIASSSVGVNTTAYKLYAFAFGAFWAGLAGALFSAKMQFVSPESFTFMESVLILCMVILGGLGSVHGVIIGAVILVVLPEMLREVQNYRMFALGIGLVLLMIFRPQGLFRPSRLSRFTEKNRASMGEKSASFRD